MGVTPRRRVAAAAALLLLDALWLYIFMGRAYRKMIPRIQGRPMRARASTAAAAYLLMVIGLQQFVLCAHAEARAPGGGAARAFLFGLVLYGVYDLTAASVLAEWDLGLGAVDMLWGGAVFALAYGCTRRL